MTAGEMRRAAARTVATGLRPGRVRTALLHLLRPRDPVRAALEEAPDRRPPRSLPARLLFAAAATAGLVLAARAGGRPPPVVVHGPRDAAEPPSLPAPDPEVRAALAEAASDLRSGDADLRRAAVGSVEAALRSPDAARRWALADALAAHLEGDPPRPARRHLLALCRDPDGRVRLRARVALLEGR